MVRKPRIHVPGGIYHVIVRGNGGQKIFYRAEDYSRCGHDEFCGSAFAGSAQAGAAIEKASGAPEIESEIKL